MPSFSSTLEAAIHNALGHANQRKHELATLEHLLLALLDEPDAARVMKACGVDLDKLRKNIVAFLDEELDALISDVDGSEAAPTTGFQRVIQRAAIHVQSSGRSEVTGANVLVAIFAERESHAAYFLQEQDMTRYDAVNYISHGVAKDPSYGEARPVKGAESSAGTEAAGRPDAQGCRGDRTAEVLRRPEREGPPGRRRSADRPRPRGRALHPGAVPPAQEQPAARRRPRRGQDGDRRGPGAQDRRRRDAGGAGGHHHLLARHGRAAGRHPLSRRLRGAAQGRDEGAGEAPERDPLHRRDPHGDRRRRDVAAARWTPRTC